MLSSERWSQKHQTHIQSAVSLFESSSLSESNIFISSSLVLCFLAIVSITLPISTLMFQRRRKVFVIGWGQNNSLGSGGAVRPPAGLEGEAPSGSSVIFTNSA